MRAYGGVTRSFVEFCGEVGLRYVDEVRPKHVEAYLLWLRRTKRLKSATVNHRRAALVTWWRFVIGQEAATANPAAQTRCAG